MIGSGLPPLGASLSKSGKAEPSFVARGSYEIQAALPVVRTLLERSVNFGNDKFSLSMRELREARSGSFLQFYMPPRWYRRKMQ